MPPLAPTLPIKTAPRQSPRHVLLCVAGLTPQIVTETLYALTQLQSERVDEIRVITTRSGRDRIVGSLLDPHEGRFAAFCRDYGIDPADIVFTEETIALLRAPDGDALDDIRTLEDNARAADQICEIVRELTGDPHTRLHASVAGGRKTMGVYLTAAMQLFGRAQDRLSHVLVSEPFETHPGFYYVPPEPRVLEVRDRQGRTRTLSTAEARIQLADVPFIRLRGLIPEWMRRRDGGYGDIVRQAQEDLDLSEEAHRLRIRCRSKSLAVSNRRVRLSVMEFFLHALLAFMRRQRRGEDGFVRLDEITVEDLDATFRRITRAGGREFGLEDSELVAGFDFLEQLRDQLAGAHPEDFKHLNVRFGEIISKSRKKARRAGVPTSYLMTARGRGAARRYGLGVEPERIVWEDQASLPGSRMAD